MNNDELNGSAPVGLYEIADGAPIADGGLVCLDGNGKAVPGADAAGLKFVGVAEGSRDGLVKVGCGIVRLPHAGLTRVMRGGSGLRQGQHHSGKCHGEQGGVRNRGGCGRRRRLDRHTAPGRGRRARRRRIWPLAQRTRRK